MESSYEEQVIQVIRLSLYRSLYLSTYYKATWRSLPPTSCLRVSVLMAVKNKEYGAHHNSSSAT